jgi:hypothetical protein
VPVAEEVLAGAVPVVVPEWVAVLEGTTAGHVCTAPPGGVYALLPLSGLPVGP